MILIGSTLTPMITVCFCWFFETRTSLYSSKRPDALIKYKLCGCTKENYTVDPWKTWELEVLYTPHPLKPCSRKFHVTFDSPKTSLIAYWSFHHIWHPGASFSRLGPLYIYGETPPFFFLFFLTAPASYALSNWLYLWAGPTAGSSFSQLFHPWGI